MGQEQVTTPLAAALDSGRINHAYLFSGPRGCGKTSSARIMARSLNCAQGPTSTPCGTCPSCVSLAPGGAGNLDVTELDAASHNGVEDMRELRDRAYYAPAESRYRIFIIDEAHMITASGANALLKVVEEPPEHVIFIFATTEPEKIIGTIRSRTHHYPFRLLTPPAMRGLLQRTVEAENVQVEDSVYPMVIQAGGGSPRDTLSILDQLLAGAGAEGLTYELARPLLGVTDLTLIDDTVAALAAGDKAGLFQLVDDVIEAGHEPRRFAVDLLDRLRDLMILQAVPDAIQAGLVDAPTDRAEVLAAQAQQFGEGHLPYLASQVSDQIGELRGATSPRLLLEILCAKLISTPAPAAAPAPQFPAPRQQSGTAQPAAQDSGSQAGAPSGAAPTGAAAAAATAAAIAAARRNRNAQAQQPTQPAQPAQTQQPDQPQQPHNQPAAAQPPAPEPTPQQSEQTPDSRPEPAQEQPQEPKQEPAQQPPAQPDAGQLTEQIRSQWAKLRADVGKSRKHAEIMLTEAQVLGIKDETLVLGHTTGALAQRLNAPENNDAIVKVIQDEFDVKLAVKCVIGTDPAQAGFAAAQEPKPAWNPNQNQRESAAADDQESERPRPAAESTPEPEHNSEQEASAAAEKPQESKPAESEPEDLPAARHNEAPEPAQADSEEEQVSQHEAQKEAAEEAEETAEPQQKPEPREQQADSGGWGAPRPLGGQEAAERSPEASAPAPQQSEPTPEAPQRPVQPAQPPQFGGGQKGNRGPAKTSQPSWRDRIAQAAEQAKSRDAAHAANTFSNGVPLPDEPGPDDSYDGPPPEPDYGSDYGSPSGQPAQRSQPREQPAQQPSQPYSRDDEEREMMEAAQETGEHDHRSATEVAMELLSQELGAKRL